MTMNLPTIVSGTFIAALIASALMFGFYLIALRKIKREVRTSADEFNLESAERLLKRCLRAGWALTVVWIVTFTTIIAVPRMHGFGEEFRSALGAAYPFLIMTVPMACWTFYTYASVKVEWAHAISEDRECEESSLFRLSLLVVGLSLYGLGVAHLPKLLKMLE